MGKEWSLMIYVQELLSMHRKDASMSPCISSHSKNVGYHGNECV